MTQGIELSELIKALRAELERAKDEEAAIRFDVEGVEIQLQTKVTREGGVKASSKVKFWVLDGEAEADGKLAKATLQTINLKLKPKAKVNPGKETVPDESKDLTLSDRE